jgi:hypothetical protein
MNDTNGNGMAGSVWLSLPARRGMTSCLSFQPHYLARGMFTVWSDAMPCVDDLEVSTTVVFNFVIP